MPCYDPRDRFSYHDDQSSDLRHTIRELKARNTEMTRILCAVGHLYEDIDDPFAKQGLDKIPGFKKWWKDHQLVDALVKKAANQQGEMK